MASGSPRTRINQFFASKKRKSLSPGLKTGRTEKDAKTTFEGSPSAKGTLDNYLVTSDDDNRIPRPLARQGPVKRNLTLEINLSSEEKNKHTPPSAQVCSQTFESCTEPQREISRCSSKADDVASRGLAKDCSVSAHHADYSELKQFASDFLSLYCSGLPSKVCSPSDLKANIYKRHGSPSLLDVEDKTSKKRHCLTERDQSRLQGEATCSKEKDSEDLKSAFVVKTGETVLRSHVATEVRVGNDPTELPACLRKCNKTSKSSINITECLTPGLLPVTTCAGETPKSLRKSSNFSPGEEFWNEAIQVADGLFAPIDNIPVQHAGEIDIAKNQYEIKNSYNFRNGSCDGEKKVFDKDDRSFQHRENIGSLVSMRKHLNSLDKDISPLPVKHFDFFSEEKNLGDNNPEHRSEDIKKGITHRGGEPSECGSVNHKGPRTSNILLRCGKAQTSREVHKVQGTTPTNTVTNIKVDASSQDNDSFTYDPSVKEIGKLIATRERDEASTPSSFAPLKDCLDLSNWLPSEICSIYRKRGISKLYSWQVECLQVDGVLQKRNLVYCASTSAGKSFVAEILMLRRVILTGKMALLVLPYVSLCAEKAEHLEVLLEPVGKHVRSYYGNQGGGTLPKDTSVAVCTIEKANSLINRLLEEGRLSELGIIVIDELHMVGDQHRGYLLELMLTKLRYAAGEGNAESSSGESSGTSSGKGDPAHGLQIVGMSATMPNVAAVADWLQAALYQTEFRPVPLEEYIKVGNTIYNKNMDIVRTISKAADLGGKDPDHVVELCNELLMPCEDVLRDWTLY